MGKQPLLRVGILGAAQIAPKAMIEPSALIEGVSVAAVAARDAARARAFASRHSIRRTCDDYEQLIAAADIDLVYNALPVSEHLRWSEAALRAGKHVLCEKPLAMNVEQVQRLLQATRPQSRLIEAFHSCYHPAFETLRRWLDDPAMGKVVSVAAHFNVSIVDDGNNIRHRPALGGGAMMDLGCYPVMWALFVLGAAPEKVEAKAVMTEGGVDERMRARLKFKEGATATLSTSMAVHEPFSNALSITTEHAQIEFDNPLLPQHGRLTRRVPGREEVATIDSGSTYEHQLARIVAALASGQVLPTEGAALLRQQRTLDRIYVAAGLSHLREA